MPSVNIQILVGNVGKDPVVKYTQNNTPVANFSVATSKSWKDKNTGEWKENTQWHRIVAWRHLAEKVERSVKKGTQVYVKGETENRSYEQDGVTKYITEVIANEIIVLGKKPQGGNGNADHGDDDLPW